MPIPFQLLLIIHTLATAFMTGLIFLVQGVHYPLFNNVGSTEFCEYHTQHARRITYIVAPIMLLELCSGGALLWLQPHNQLLQWNSAGIAVIWLCTAVVQVPLHRQLSNGPIANRQGIY